jgi:hypothetical protein
VGVQFKVDGVNQGAEDTSSPYSMSWDATAAANGAHIITVTARDAAGNTATSSSVNVTVDNTPPTVSVTAPAASATVQGATVSVTATAADNVAVAGVQFQLDWPGANCGLLGAEDTSSPYSFTWNTTTLVNGTHTISAVARDAAGNTTTSAVITVTVNNPSPPPPDTTAPTTPTGLNSPSKTTTTITLAWNASTDSGGAGLAGYEIYRSVSGGAFTFLTSTSLLTFPDTGLSPGTAYSYKLAAYDFANPPNKSAQSSALAVTTNTSPAPTVSLIANPTSLLSGAASSLTWSSTNATSCSASGAWNGSKATSGTATTGALSVDSTFNLACTGAGGTANASATVTITASTPPPTPTPAPTPGKKGDLNNDNTVNIFDLSILLSHYGASGSGDIDTNGAVNVIDLSILLSNYGK